MITTINEFKQLLNETNMPDKNTTMTIEELLNWYTGDDGYENNLDVIEDSFVTYDNQPIDISILLNNKNEVVTISSADIGNTIDNEFELNGIIYAFDSLSFPGVRPEDY